MKQDLLDSFNTACDQARVISELPNLSEQQYEKIFQHVSNADMHTTIRTINYAYRMIRQELAQ